MRRNKKRPLLQSLAVSYLLVLTPMLLLCYALYRSQYSSLESSMSEMQYAQLHRYQGAIQSELTDLNLLSNQLYITVSQTNVAIRSRQDLQSTDHTTMLRLRNQISNTLRTAKSTEEILLYLGRNGYGITSLRALPLEQLYALTKDHESLWKSWDELVAMLQSYRQAGLHHSGDTLYFLTGLGNDACALFNLRPDYLIDLYGETSSDEFFALTTLEGDILFQNHVEFPLDIAALAAGSEPEGASDWLITRLRLQNFDYYVISLRSRAALRGALLSQTAQLLPAIVVCTLISFLIIFYSVRRNYNPVAEVLKALAALDMPVVRVAAEVGELFRAALFNVAPGHVLPLAHAHLAQLRLYVQRYVVVFRYRRRRRHRARQVARVERVDALVFKAPGQGGDLPHAARGYLAVVPALDAAEEVALRLSVPYYENPRHNDVSFPRKERRHQTAPAFRQSLSVPSTAARRLPISALYSERSSRCFSLRDAALSAATMSSVAGMPGLYF